MIHLLNVHSLDVEEDPDMLDFVDIVRANERALQVDARNIELRRQYHEIRTIERLERALRVARERVSFSPAPQAG